MNAPADRSSRLPGGLVWALLCLAAACSRTSSDPAEVPSVPAPSDAWRDTCLRDSPIVGLERETVPGLDLQLDGHLVRTGSLGQRGPDLEPDASAFRIAALGGAFTFGLGLDQAEPWPTLLQEHIGGSMLVAGKRVEVTNLGTLDADLPGLEALFAARLGERLPWLAVFELDLDDLAGAPDAGRVERLRALLRPDSQAWKQSEAALAALRARCAPAGVGLVVMITPLDAGVPWSEYPLGELHRDLARAITRQDCVPLDLLEFFAREPRESLRGSEAPAHWNARAQALAMDALKRKCFEAGLFSIVLDAHQDR